MQLVKMHTVTADAITLLQAALTDSNNA